MQPPLRSLVDESSHRTYALDDRLTIGRAETADVQLVHRGVSRQHAVIEREEDGSHVITDLQSKAGTRLDGSTVRHAVLHVGAVIEICGFRLRVAPPAPRGRIESAPNITGDIAARPTLLDSSTLPTVVDGDWRNVLRDVVGIREIEEDAPQSPRARDLVARFQEDVAARPEGSRRRSRRHRIETQIRIGVLRGSSGTTVQGHMLDASASGAKLQTAEPLPIGGLCWILVATGEDERSGVAFSARVIWRDLDAGLVGVAFVGKPMSGPNVLPPTRRQ
jgi:hypothetical protein